MYKKISLTITFVTVFSVSGWSSADEEIQLNTDDKKFSYSVGSRIGQQLKEQFLNQPGFDTDAFLSAFTSTFNGDALLLSEQEIVASIQKMQQQELQKAALITEEKVAMGKAFLDENRSRDGVIETESGLQYMVLSSGDDSGESPAITDTVIVHYQGTLIDGTVFDSSYSRGEPAQFSLGSVIKGWGEVLQLMKPGDKWSIVLPAELAYGERGAGQSIGPNETLLFDVELLEVKRSTN